MQIIKIILLLTLLTSSLGSAATFNDKFLNYKNYSKKIDDYSLAQRSSLLEERYLKLFSKEIQYADLKKRKSPDLANLFLATDEIAFYTLEKSHVNTMTDIFKILVSKNLATDKQINTLYGAYISTRMFHEAQELKKTYPTILKAEQPEIINADQLDTNKKSVWRLGLNSNILERKNINIGHGVQIIMIAHPLCHFSNNAIQDIQSDLELKNLVLPNLKLLAPQDRHLNLSVFKKWNSEHPDMSMSIVHLQSEWPELEKWSTPIFYFYKDGALKSTLVGWPKEGNKEKLMQELKKVGINTEREISSIPRTLNPNP
jgi:thioredoxin-related protein